MSKKAKEKVEKYHFYIEKPLIDKFEEIWSTNSTTKELKFTYPNEKVQKLLEEFIKSEGQIMQYHDLYKKQDQTNQDLLILKEKFNKYISLANDIKEEENKSKGKV